MTLRKEFAALDSLLEPFLFASIGEQKNGTELTVISGLAQLGVDPWVEAARLSTLSKSAAAEALATGISSLTTGWTRTDSAGIARRLVELLPVPQDRPMRPAIPGIPAILQIKALRYSALLPWVILGLTLVFYLVW